MDKFFQQLPDDVKEKIKGCKTEEEVMDILKQDNIPIPEEALEAITGGGFWERLFGSPQKKLRDVTFEWK